GPLVTRQHRYIHEVKERYPLHRFMRSAKILRQLRAVKSAREVAVMQKAAEITGDVFRHLLSFIRPGVMEYEIEAEIWKGFLSRRSTGPAYESIIASGDRARTLHYIVNDGQCRGGELVLMDFGAAFGGYNADMTRTVPVSGKFSGRQRELYDAVLSLHADAKHLLRPGITLADYNKKMGERATEVFIGVGLLTEAEVRDQTPESPAYMKYMYHGVSHHLGIDVHDLGPRTEPLREGMVLTVEPGVYVAEEGIGIRIENDIWIQPGANVDLMENVPISADEIEGWMNKRK
ncbi:MAG TPA: M24 family metallopeptidase, partial [Puia sp.]|nr:M24 family metallopeptidase [Puia sp.]